jgi:hypothetical protein
MKIFYNTLVLVVGMSFQLAAMLPSDPDTLYVRIADAKKKLGNDAELIAICNTQEELVKLVDAHANGESWSPEDEAKYKQKSESLWNLGISIHKRLQALNKSAEDGNNDMLPQFLKDVGQAFTKPG